MKTVEYLGPFVSVSVPALGYQRVELGVPVEVDDDLAAALLEQESWGEPGAQRKPRASRTSKPRAPRKRAAEPVAAPDTDPS